MRRTLCLLVILGTLVAAFGAAQAQQRKPAGRHSGGDAQFIARIKAFREAGEKKLRDQALTRKTVPFTGANASEALRQKWSKMDAYFDGGKLVRIQLYPHQGISGRTEEFYLMDNKLVFAFIQDKGPKHEGRDMGEPGKELYFRDDRLLDFVDRSGEKAGNVEMEKRMYEAGLPYEIEEVLPLLAGSK